ncbi:hypothetical protein PS2_026378 [Malus domestica]
MPYNLPIRLRVVHSHQNKQCYEWHSCIFTRKRITPCDQCVSLLRLCIRPYKSTHGVCTIYCNKPRGSGWVVSYYNLFDAKVDALLAAVEKSGGVISVLWWRRVVGLRTGLEISPLQNLLGHITGIL